MTAKQDFKDELKFDKKRSHGDGGAAQGRTFQSKQVASGKALRCEATECLGEGELSTAGVWTEPVAMGEENCTGADTEGEDYEDFAFSAKVLPLKATGRCYDVLIRGA